MQKCVLGPLHFASALVSRKFRENFCKNRIFYTCKSSSILNGPWMANLISRRHLLYIVAEKYFSSVSLENQKKKLILYKHAKKLLSILLMISMMFGKDLRSTENRVTRESRDTRMSVRPRDRREYHRKM